MIEGIICVAGGYIIIAEIVRLSKLLHEHLKYRRKHEQHLASSFTPGRD
jgi:hypothetical protein